MIPLLIPNHPSADPSHAFVVRMCALALESPVCRSAHVCRPLPGARAGSQATQGLQNVNLLGVAAAEAAGRDGGARLAAHPLLKQSASSGKGGGGKRKSSATAAGGSGGAGSGGGGGGGGSATSFSFSSGAQGFAPAQHARGGLSSSPSGLGRKRAADGGGGTDDGGGGGGGKKKKKKKKKKGADGASERFSFK